MQRTMSFRKKGNLLIKSLVVGSFLFSSSYSLASTLSEADKTQIRLEFAPALEGENIFYQPPMQNITLFGAKVSGLDSCNGDVAFTITNAFTDGTLAKIYENFEEVAKSLVSTGGMIYLGSLLLQKANPGLYQLVTDGFSLGVDDFLSGMASCEAMGQALVSQIDYDVKKPVNEADTVSKYNQMISNTLSDASKKYSKTDLTQYVSEGIDKAADEGFEWYADKSDTPVIRGGQGDPVNFTADVVRRGYCVYRGIEAKNCEASLSTSSPKAKDANNAMQGLIFDTVGDVERAAVQIFGTDYITVCTGCETVSIKGMGVLAYLHEIQVKVYTVTKQLADYPIAQHEENDYKKLSAPPSINLNAEYFRAFAIMESEMEMRDLFIQGYAFEVAYYRTIKALETLELAMDGSLDTSAGKSMIKSTEEMMARVGRERERLDRYVESKGWTPLKYNKAIMKVLQNKSISAVSIGN